jgi:hypothetical protein
MTDDDARAFGQRLQTECEEFARKRGLRDEDVLALLLSLAYAQAKRLGLQPERDPRPLLERAVNLWDALAESETRIVIPAFSMQRTKDGSFRS